MSEISILRTDILSEDIKTVQDKIKIIAETQFVNIINNAEKLNEKTKSPNPAKSIIEVMRLIKDAIEDYHKREHATEDAKVNITYEEPDTEQQLEAVSIKLVKREPGMYGQGRPFENKVRQLRPLLRELVEDPDNPGYKRAVLGQFYDNVLRLTCWARTNKTANDRALWLENVMEEYAWFFVISGVGRVLYQGRPSEVTKEVNNNKFYGRPIDYFVRTEKLRSVSQKKLEEVCIRFQIIPS